ncbi:hypothetical protein ACA910_001916 [Epithemia clementina (nom. ined.)]
MLASSPSVTAASSTATSETLHQMMATLLDIDFPSLLEQPSPQQQQQEQEVAQRKQLDSMFSTSSLSASSASAFSRMHLAKQLVGDVVVGVSVTALIAPSLTVVDKALVQRSAGSHTFMASAQQSLSYMFQRPWSYLKSPTFLWMWATYATTYSTANALKTLADHYGGDSQTTMSPSGSAATTATKNNIHNNTSVGCGWGTLVFLGTTAANSSASLCKDRAYARMFGTSTAIVVPPMAYGLWLARDFTVIGSSFVLPPMVAQHLEQARGGAGGGGAPSASSLALAQFATPLAAQLVAGPLHYLGLDLCNRPVVATLLDRWVHLRQGLSSVITARMVRILPGYGLGGVWNQQGRQAWKTQFCAPPPPAARTWRVLQRREPRIVVTRRITTHP